MPRSKVSLSHRHLTTGNLGDFIPLPPIPVLPGDVVGHNISILARVTPLAAPVMHEVDLEVRHYYAPNRVLWDDNDGTDWEEFITGGEDGMNADTVPTISTTGITEGDALCHMGIPTVAGIDINALPLRMYNFCHNEHVRDQDLQTTKRLLTDKTLAKVNWAGDYLTNARPWSAKGPSVSLPVGDAAPVAANLAPAGQPTIYTNGGYYHLDADAGLLDVSGTTGLSSEALYADLSSATGADPIAFRRAWAIQRFMEHAAIYGSRYPEKMRSLGSNYQGVMDRPIILGGGRSTMNFSEVLQTANDTSDRDYGVGDMYGHGVAAMRSNKYAKRIDEHGLILTCIYVRPRPMYMHGIHKEFLRQDREDFHDPFLEDIGMQEAYVNEVWADATDGDDVFGYTPRYEEYRGMPSSVSGQFRTTLDYWHMGRKLSAKPTLNSAFKTMDGSTTAMKRSFNEQTNDSLWIAARQNIVVHRNISKRARTRLV